MYVYMCGWGGRGGGGSYAWHSGNALERMLQNIN